jgi:hypothetical protein
MLHLGPLLAQAVMFNICGNAARSELDKISDPLKKLVARQVRSKAWLECALFQTAVANDKSTDTEKRMFLQKVTG